MPQLLRRSRYPVGDVPFGTFAFVGTCGRPPGDGRVGDRLLSIVASYCSFVNAPAVLKPCIFVRKGKIDQGQSENNHFDNKKAEAACDRLAPCPRRNRGDVELFYFTWMALSNKLQFRFVSGNENRTTRYNSCRTI
jgi:hypothetical protein